jgi:putative toxin-antitoxin system antitoxin component (TIGR02293 family)
VTRRGSAAVKKFGTKGEAVTAARNAAKAKWKALPKDMAYFRAAPLDRVRIVKTGVPAVQAKAFLGALSTPSGRLYEALDLKPSTVNRKVQKKELLSTDESERIMGLVKLFGQVEAMVQESGDPSGFNAREWTMHWLSEPLAAFGGVRPMDLMDTMEGQTLISDALARIQTGAYA